jgi:hypothetical protein
MFAGEPNLQSEAIELSPKEHCSCDSLMFQGHLKGYISHERQTVVLAKEKPFPDIIGKQLAV